MYIEREFNYKNKDYSITISGVLKSGRVGDGSTEYEVDNIFWDIFDENCQKPTKELHQEICDAFEKENPTWYDDLLDRV